MTLRIPGTGQSACHDEAGQEILCQGSGQDAEFSRPDPAPRLIAQDELVEDALTGLVWTRSANILGYPLPWAEALATVAALNREGFLGHGDWRLPNRRELRSLVCHGASRPALPPGHPFRDVFLGWYWTSSTKAGQTTYAWNVHFEGGRMFYSRKDEYRLLWPVRGESGVLARTGQTACYDSAGLERFCVEMGAGMEAGTGQDGELRRGVAWPSPRLERVAGAMPGSVPGSVPGAVRDRLTGLVWLAPERLPREVFTWRGALDYVAEGGSLGPGWRLPDINELESLVDAGRADPALPPELLAGEGDGDAASSTGEGFWSSTTSGYDPAWAYVLYAQKGAVGVGFKPGREFHLWPVRREPGADALCAEGPRSPTG